VPSEAAAATGATHPSNPSATSSSSARDSSKVLLSWTVTDGLGAPLFSAADDYDDDDEDGDDRAAFNQRSAVR